MGKFSRDKGARFERQIVNALNDNGIEAKRVPLSGATSFQKGDVVIDGRIVCELKHRESGFKKIYEYKEGAKLLIIKQNQYEPLIIMTFEDFIAMYKTSGGVI